VSEKDSLLLIDASGLLYRSFFALPPLTSPAGEPTGALFGFIRSLLKVFQAVAPTSMVAIFDGPDNKASRLKIFPEYKATRKPMVPELGKQIEEAKRFCSLWGIATIAAPGVEADDTIASISTWASHDTHIYICSADKDLLQLVSESISLINPAKNDKIFTPITVESEWGIAPTQIVDYLSLVGDSSDNVPGVEGIGPKTARSLLQTWGSLDNLLAHLEALKGKQKERLQQGSALLSRQLITLDTTVPIPHDRSFYQKKETDVHGLTMFFQEKGFKSFDALLASQEEAPPPSPVTIIQNQEELETFTGWLQQQSCIILDCETTSLDEANAELVGIGIAATLHPIYYLACSEHLSAQTIVSALNAIIHTKQISFIGHNIKYDLHILHRYGLELPQIAFDTLIASWLLHANERTHSLDELALRYFHKKKIPIESLIGKGKTSRSMKEVPINQVATYCAEDVEYTYRLYKLFEKELEEKELVSLFSTIELPLIPVLLRMEEHGIYVDTKKLNSLHEQIGDALHAVTQEIYQIIGHECNINSPKVLRHVLFEELGLPKQGRKESTSIDVLEQLTAIHPIAQKIIEYRQLEKLRSTYLETLPKQIRKTSQRIHCHFIQSGSATGRLACRDPNLQNIPIKTDLGKEIRAAFRPQSDDAVFVSADYSQIELRILAHISQDPTLLQAFREDADIHSATAAEIFDVRPEEVTEEMRRKAKAVNFGISYGQQAFGLAKTLKISTKEAHAFIEHYFQKYPKVKETIEKAKETAHQTAVAETLTGRRRELPEIHNQDFFIRSAAERLAINTPFQGTTADIIKIAMIAIDRWLLETKKRTKMLLQIHDELIFEVPREELEIVIPTIRQYMESAMPFSVPLKVDISIGKTWKEC